MSDEIELPEEDDFADPAFANNNMSLFQGYCEQRIQGRSELWAFRHTFGSAFIADGKHFSRIHGLERNAVYKRLFAERMASIKSTELWGPKVAINELLQIVRNPLNKETARLAAIKELNILYNITITDPAGNTKPGRSLDDFYRQEAGEKPVPGETTQEPAPTTH